MTPHIHHMLRHPLTFRTLRVLRTWSLTPHMQRIVFGSDELAGFASAAPDDHVKLFFPNASGDIVTPSIGDNGAEYTPGVDYSPMRDYTPRHYDSARNELTIDFVLHGHGPASLWAAQAQPDQCIGVAGPRGSFVIADDFDHYVLIGDETALPAIGRWLMDMPPNTAVDALIEVDDARDRQPLPSPAHVTVHWFERNGGPADRSDRLEQALRDMPAPAGDTFYWIAAESRRARAMRQWLTQERQVPKDWMKAKGYWKAGTGDSDDES